uniref:NADH-ubiquinone oxidoreductase chain 3 n=1 Tax=Monoserius pennarius TaxID=2203294 RepID=A0AA96KH01_9CNID|nr:NADH dehydrogenase subunit 3 [Monoserius pennarius]WNO18778.1 NADH dehydrogenase subunit 3 [Monoserius pennarius]
MNLNILTLFFFIIFGLGLSLIIVSASIFISEKTPSEEKVSTYECGFDPIHSPGQPFSIKFFLIGILFLIFDLEIVYLFPWSITTNLINIKSQIIIAIFIILLVIGLIYEWVRGGLEWE